MGTNPATAGDLQRRRQEPQQLAMEHERLRRAAEYATAEYDRTRAALVALQADPDAFADANEGELAKAGLRTLSETAVEVRTAGAVGWVGDRP
jgi:hypothetical protein